MTTSSQKKHPCPDCKQCQQCSQARCNLCRCQNRDRFAGMSISEQIRVYEALNRRPS